METIKFSVKSFWFKLWEMVSFYPVWYERPSDTCTLKRQLIFRIVGTLLSPILFVLWMIAFRVSKTLKEMEIGPLLHLLNIFLQLLGMVAFNKLGLVSLWLGPIILVACIGIGGGLTFLGIYTVETIQRRNALKPKSSRKDYKEPMVVTLYKGWKDKLCSKIEYVDDVEDREEY